jgi:sugar lactone lactonase YvrE
MISVLRFAGLTDEFRQKVVRIGNRLLIVLVPVAVLAFQPHARSTYQIGSRALIYDQRAQYFVDPAARIEVVYSNLEEGRGLAYDTSRSTLIVADAFQGLIPLKMPPPVSPPRAGEVCPERHCISVDHGGLLLDRAGDLLLSDTQVGRLVVRDGASFEFKGTVGSITLLRKVHDATMLPEGVLIVGESDLEDEDPEGRPTRGALYAVSADRTEKIDAVVSHPVGLAYSPGERRLYVSDLGAAMKRWIYFQRAGSQWRQTGVLWSEPIAGLRTRPLLQDMAIGTGRVDSSAGLNPAEASVAEREAAREVVFAAGLDGIYVFHPDGALLAKYVLGDVVTGLAWGDGGDLYLTSGRRVGMLRTRATAVASERPESVKPASTLDGSHEGAPKL